MNTLMDVLRHRPGWVEVKDEGEWDFYWCDVSWLRENFDHTYMDEHVRISHFRNHYELTRKNYMVKNLKRFRKQLEREAGKLEAAKCDFFPKTFEMPCEYHLFVEEFRKNPGITWIMKPVAGSQGKGIFLFRRLKDIMDWSKGTAGKKLASLEAPPARSAVNPSGSHDARSSDDQKDEIPVENYVAQRYIENPYLIGGRKFDLRVYVLVMSYIPLRAWLYRDGFARFSNTRFTLSSIDDQYVHLTNVAVQKTSPDYHPKKGCKWMLQRFRQYLASKHGPEAVETLFGDMDNIFVRSLQSVQKAIISDKHCFELYGYDILIDQNLKPWLLEVNASPSLTASSQEDYELKTRLLEDTLHVVDMEARWGAASLRHRCTWQLALPTRKTEPTALGLERHVGVAEACLPCYRWTNRCPHRVRSWSKGSALSGQRRTNCSLLRFSPAGFPPYVLTMRHWTSPV
ncbi:probable tubulin polyglutamylase TTLL9 isoform X3 [Ailuropoda melanoleuca]|nr:probable tubulin polyglutamylase TTLL9 isoform X3 [Ailuropoda melanoleuca]